MAGHFKSAHKDVIHSGSVPCPRCPKLCVSMKKMRIHFLDYHRDGRFKCAECEFESKLRPEVRKHHRQIHGRGQAITRNDIQSPEQVNSSHQSNHSVSIIDEAESEGLIVRSLNCIFEDCDNSFVNQWEFDSHLLSEHEIKHFPCWTRGCLVSFDSL